jgi:hypothetical protein
MELIGNPAWVPYENGVPRTCPAAVKNNIPSNSRKKSADAFEVVKEFWPCRVKFQFFMNLYWVAAHVKKTTMSSARLRASLFKFG